MSSKRVTFHGCVHDRSTRLETKVTYGCTRSGKRYAAKGLMRHAKVAKRGQPVESVKVEPDDTHYILRSSGCTTGPLWVPVPRTAGIYSLPMEMRQGFLEAERRQMAMYPEKDPRLFPFTGRVPPIPDAEAKEKRVEELDRLIEFIHYRISTTMPILTGVKGHLREEARKLEAERDALLDLLK